MFISPRGKWVNSQELFFLFSLCSSYGVQSWPEWRGIWECFPGYGPGKWTDANTVIYHQSTENNQIGSATMLIFSIKNIIMNVVFDDFRIHPRTKFMSFFFFFREGLSGTLRTLMVSYHWLWLFSYHSYAGPLKCGELIYLSSRYLIHCIISHHFIGCAPIPNVGSHHDTVSFNTRLYIPVVLKTVQYSWVPL